MSILDTFVIMFDSDASKVKEGADKAKKSTKDLEKELSASDKMAGKVGSSFLGMAKSAAGALAGIVAVGSIFGSMGSWMDEADRAGKVADSIGAGVQDVVAWGHAAKLSGGSIEGLQGSLKALNVGITEVATTGTGGMLPYLNRLGIGIRKADGAVKSSIDLLPELAKSFEKLSKTESAGLGAKMGLDEGTVMLLQQGGKAVDELVARQKRLSSITKEAAAASAAFHDALDDSVMSGKAMIGSIGMFFLPALTGLFNGLANLGIFVREHKTVVSSFLLAIVGILGAMYIPAMLSAAAATIVAFAPFILLGAAIGALSAAFALLFEDIEAFMNGSNSMIGEVSKKWPIVGEIVKGWVHWLTTLKDIAVAVFGLLVDLIMEPTKAWDNFTAAIVKSMAPIRGALDLVSKAVDKTKSFFGFGPDEEESDDNVTMRETKKAIEIGQASIAMASSTPIASQTSNSIINGGRAGNTNSVKIDNVTVQTQATDANGIARDIGSNLESQMRQAASNFDDGVAY